MLQSLQGAPDAMLLLRGGRLVPHPQFPLPTFLFLSLAHCGSLFTFPTHSASVRGESI